VTADRYLIVIESAGKGYSAFSPDLPGCIATGKSVDETRARMREAVRLHVQGLQEDGLPVPPARAIAEYLAVA
jgi:predicted RNase H-like HicB family nuclease